MDTKYFYGGRMAVYTEPLRKTVSVAISAGTGVMKIDQAKALRDALNEAIQFAEEEVKRMETC